MTTSLFNESPLLGDAESVLADAAFQTRREFIPDADVPWLLAENEFFVVAVMTTRTLPEAHRAEAFGAAELLTRISASDVGAKRWDAYLVVLSEELADGPDETRELAELQYDTRGVRRLMATGVTDRALVVQALRPFLPLPRPVPGGLSDALTDMVDQLTLNGVDQSSSERYIAAFAETGHLDDV